MVTSSLTRLAGVITRRRTAVASCAACHAPVFGDEHHVRLHGLVLHRRCVAYRRRG